METSQTTTIDGDTVRCENGVYHSLDRPAIITRNGNERYFIYGIEIPKDVFIELTEDSRMDSGLAITDECTQTKYVLYKHGLVLVKNEQLGVVCKYTYNNYGNLHSFFDEPSFLKIGNNFQYFKYHKDGVLHRIFGPAEKCRRHTAFYVNGKLHSQNDNPALQEFDTVGRLIRETYYHEDVIHRDERPAVISYDSFQNVIREEFWKDGILIRADQ